MGGVTPPDVFTRRCSIRLSFASVDRPRISKPTFLDWSKCRKMSIPLDRWVLPTRNPYAARKMGQSYSKWWKILPIINILLKKETNAFTSYKKKRNFSTFNISYIYSNSIFLSFKNVLRSSLNFIRLFVVNCEIWLPLSDQHYRAFLNKAEMCPLLELQHILWYVMRNVRQSPQKP